MTIAATEQPAPLTNEQSIPVLPCVLARLSGRNDAILVDDFQARAELGIQLIAQLPFVRKRMDIVRWGAWPASVRLRQGLHIFLTAFALLMALSVGYADITQVRIVMYVAIALIHFGKVVRLARYYQ